MWVKSGTVLPVCRVIHPHKTKSLPYHPILQNILIDGLLGHVTTRVLIVVCVFFFFFLQSHAYARKENKVVSPTLKWISLLQVGVRCPCPSEVMNSISVY